MCCRFPFHSFSFLFFFVFNSSFIACARGYVSVCALQVYVHTHNSVFVFQLLGHHLVRSFSSFPSFLPYIVLLHTVSTVACSRVCVDSISLVFYKLNETINLSTWIYRKTIDMGEQRENHKAMRETKRKTKTTAMTTIKRKLLLLDIAREMKW